MFEPGERRYLSSARVGRLATADADGRPNAVPVCFALVDDTAVTPIDEKPQGRGPRSLRRSRDVRENPHVSLVVDHYTEEWDELGWVQIRGTATHVHPGDSGHATAVATLRGKYERYAQHALDERPIIVIEPGSVLSWGDLDRDEATGREGD